MPTPTKNLFAGLRVQPYVPSKAHVQKAHEDLKALLAEHSENLSGRTLGVFLDTLNTLKKGDSEAE
jgi:hypothetical protein